MAPPAATTAPSGSRAASGTCRKRHLPQAAPAASGTCRKRHLLVDTLGLVLLACVHAADLPDRDGGRLLVAGAPAGAAPDVGVVWADAAYAGAFASWLEAERGWRLEVPRHRDRHLGRHGLEEKPRGFRVLPRRWVIERTFAWLGQSRRLSKDYERLPTTSEAMIHAAMTRIMRRRLAGTTV